MPLDGKQLTALDQPLDPRAVSQRDAAGSRKLSYVEGYFVIEQANRIFGYGRWGHRVDSLSSETLGDGRLYTALVTVTVAGCEPHQDVGIGVARSAKTEEVEKAAKEAVTDALKRALRCYGDQFGNSLYDKDGDIHQQVRAAQQEDRRPTPAARPQQPAHKPAPAVEESSAIGTPVNPKPAPKAPTAAETEALRKKVLALLTEDTEKFDEWRGRGGHAELWGVSYQRLCEMLGTLNALRAQRDAAAARPLTDAQDIELGIALSESHEGLAGLQPRIAKLDDKPTQDRLMALLDARWAEMPITAGA